MTGLAATPNAFGCYDPQCGDSTWDHPCPVVPPATHFLDRGNLTPLEVGPPRSASGVPDGFDVLCTVALPMPARLAADLFLAISEVAASHGYGEVAMLTDGSNRIVAGPATAPERAS